MPFIPRYFTYSSMTFSPLFSICSFYSGNWYHYISQLCFFDFLLLPKLSLLLTLVHIFLFPFFYPFTFLLGSTIFFV
ncbi:hypothetical protein [Wolbachia endosymbiont of Frankliniella intonsa]|uniref:hypothetical protein n=1 Tax=Wolbachia endosymbiont of Frankliniella intonsa TaxID=2902422 RepID=UPI00244EE4CD|nr:hypothetical protein [Wolbachia endosymbiont of Frankliniella intonsa]WGJ62859.1 hypothetical protein M3L71_05830 [Wolbachia endosymbiont of Frankliniella intonsa]